MAQDSTLPQSFEDQAAAIVAERLHAHVQKSGICIVGLSGGNTPVPVYTALNTMDLPWDKLVFFLIDERLVPSDHPDSNQHMIQNTLLKGTILREDQVYMPNTSLKPEACTVEYAERIARMVGKNGNPHLLILGMGDDGHIASLFPPLPPVALSNDIVIHTTTNKFAVHDRLSLTLPMLRSASEAIFLLKGEAKKKVWEEMEQSHEDETRWPAKGIQKSCKTQVIFG